MNMTQKEVREIFEYKDGDLYWRHPKQGRSLTKPAGYLNSRTGYKSVSYERKQYPIHRLVYLYHYGYVPKIVRHIDGDYTNNDIRNLSEHRCLPHFEGPRGASARVRNSCGYRGVTYLKVPSKNKYRACVFLKGKLQYVGVYETPEDAARAYDKKMRKLGYHHDWLNFPDETPTKS